MVPPRARDSLHHGADYDADELEFIRAMDEFMRRTGKKFPTFVEVLDVAKSLGWRKPPPVTAANDAVFEQVSEQLRK